MKFFNMKFCLKDNNEIDYSLAFDAYSNNLEALKEVLPASVIELANLSSFDDGLIAAIRHDRILRKLTLTLRCGHDQMGYYDLVLSYEGAEISKTDEWKLACLAKMSKGNKAPDVACHEVDASNVGEVEHRILFHSGKWFAIRCQHLEWERINVPDRELPIVNKRFPDGPCTNFYGMKNRKIFERKNRYVRKTVRWRRNPLGRG